MFMTSHDFLILMFLLATKHFICDFLLQTNWMAFNKHNFKHAGGYVHALYHAIGTMIVLDWCERHGIITMIQGGLLFAVFTDFFCHYIIDWTKMNAGRKFGWTPQTQNFWYALGADQWLHTVTYLFILWYIL